MKRAKVSCICSLEIGLNNSMLGFQMSFLFSGIGKGERREFLQEKAKFPHLPRAAKLSNWHVGTFHPISTGGRKVTGIKM